MKLTLRLLVLTVALIPCAAPASPPPPFDLTPLTGWEVEDAGTATPFVREGLQSELLVAARSPRRTWVFVTLIDNTLDLPAFSATELRAMTSDRAFADLEPRSYGSEIVEIPVPEGHGVASVQALLRSFETILLPYEAGAGGEPVLVQTVSVPVVTWDEAAERYANLIYVAHFRGSPRHAADLDAFTRLWSRLRLPPGTVLVERDRFNACRPELRRRRPAPP